MPKDRWRLDGLKNLPSLGIRDDQDIPPVYRQMLLAPLQMGMQRHGGKETAGDRRRIRPARRWPRKRPSR